MDGETFGFDAGRASSQQGVFLVKPLAKSLLAVGVVGHLAEVVELAPYLFFAHRPVAWGKSGKSGRGLLNSCRDRVFGKLPSWRFLGG